MVSGTLSKRLIDRPFYIAYGYFIKLYYAPKNLVASFYCRKFLILIQFFCGSLGLPEMFSLFWLCSVWNNVACRICSTLLACSRLIPTLATVWGWLVGPVFCIKFMTTP